MVHPSWPSADCLTTRRLCLEPLRTDHAHELASLLADASLYEYIGRSPPSPAQLEARYVRQARGVSPDGAQGWLNWVLRLSAEDRIAGVVQATLSERDGAIAAELAWMVAPAEQGARLASEAAGAVAAWLRAAGVAALSAHVHPDNLASESVARHAGLVATPIIEAGETRWESPGS